jgi:hypothetical protein
LPLAIGARFGEGRDRGGAAAHENYAILKIVYGL